MSLMPERRRYRAEINIIPLMDVLTTLIFFCLAMMQFRAGQALNISLPEITTAGKNTLDRFINISVTKEGTYYYNGKVVAQDELSEILATLGHASDKPPVIIRADENVPLHNITFLMDTCRKTGFEDFRLQSRDSK